MPTFAVRHPRWRCRPSARPEQVPAAPAVGHHRAMFWVLYYEDLVDDYVERRAPLREAHLALLAAAQERGELVLAGALAEPVDGALLVFRGEGPGVAEAFVAADPYVANGLVGSWRVRPWTVVAGDPALVG